jgi:hypothetical protein
MDSDEPPAHGASAVMGPDGVVDIEAVKRRLKSTVAVLEDFSNRRAAGRSRGDYMDTVRHQAQCVGGGTAEARVHMIAYAGACS